MVTRLSRSVLSDMGRAAAISGVGGLNVDKLVRKTVERKQHVCMWCDSNSQKDRNDNQCEEGFLRKIKDSLGGLVGGKGWVSMLRNGCRVCPHRDAPLPPQEQAEKRQDPPTQERKRKRNCVGE